MERNNEMKTQENDKKISNLMKELKDAAIDLSKVRLAYGKTKIREESERTKEHLKDGIHTAAKNAKINLEVNSRKYDETRNEIDAILAEYDLAMNTLQGAYTKTSNEVTLRLTELYGKKDELTAKSHELREKIQEHNEINEVELNNKLAPLEAEKSYYEEQAIEAIQSGDYNKSRELLNKCDELKLKVYQTEEKFSNKKNPYNEKFKENFKEYTECKKQIEELEKYSKEIEENFKDACEESLESKEQALANVENNKMFDKIKGFLSKSVLKNINKTKKFKENTLIPAKNNVEKFAKSVPEKAENLKEKSKSKFKSIFSRGKEFLENTKDKVVEKAENVRDFASDKVADVKEATSQAKDFATGKAYQAKEFAKEKAGDVRDFASDKIADVKEAGSQARDYLSGKAYQAVDTAYNLGVNTVAKGRESAINRLERKIENYQERAEELRNKNAQLETKRENRNNEKGLF